MTSFDKQPHYHRWTFECWLGDTMQDDSGEYNPKGYRSREAQYQCEICGKRMSKWQSV